VSKFSDWSSIGLSSIAVARITNECVSDTEWAAIALFKTSLLDRLPTNFPEATK